MLGYLIYGVVDIVLTPGKSPILHFRSNMAEYVVSLTFYLF